jgi:hypothetical protein
MPSSRQDVIPASWPRHLAAQPRRHKSGVGVELVGAGQRGELNVSIAGLVKETEAASSHDLERIRKRIEEEFLAAKTSDERTEVLAIFTAMTDRVERGLAAGGHDELLANFRTANAYEYKSLIVQECAVGLDTPVGGGDISGDMLMAVTNREIAAGRMTENHSLRKIAVEGAAVPHLSHAELIANADLKEEAGAEGEAALAPKPDSGTVAYAVGKTLGKKLKGLFGK